MPFIASGSYGCIFQPAVSCTYPTKKSFKNNIVSKIFSDNDNFNEEKIIQKKIELIDPEHKFTIPFLGNCEITKFKNSNAADKCEHVDLKNTSKYNQLLYKYGGDDIDQLITTKKGTIIKFKKILVLLQPVIHGIKKLLDKNYVHLDIKPDNMLYNNKSVYLIDFGLMSYRKDIFQYKHILEHNYPYYPPEFKMYIYKNKSFNKFLVRFMENFSYKFKINDNKTDIYSIIKYNIDYTKDLQETDFINLNKLSIQDLQSYTDKIDIYSLGIVLLLLYSWSGFIESKSKNKKNNIIKEKIKSIIRSMIRFNPQARINIVDLIKDYDDLISII